MLKIIDKFIENFGKGGTGLIMLGNVGTGKTHVACAVLNAFLSQGKCGLILTALQTVRRIKELYGREADRTEKSALNSFFVPDLFVIDEVGVQRGSETETLILNEIIDGRYVRTKPTILVSNLTVPELTLLVGERSIDRFREGGAVLTLTGNRNGPRNHHGSVRLWGSR
jgi:DNA replication protein DnaC